MGGGGEAVGPEVACREVVEPLAAARPNDGGTKAAYATPQGTRQLLQTTGKKTTAAKHKKPRDSGYETVRKKAAAV